MKGKKVALVFITLNEPYWQYLKNVIDDCNKYFLTDRTKRHKVDFFLWTDMPEGEIPNTKVFPTEPMEWPLPTLMRYNLFLQQEEILKKYDYIFYMDTDMRVVSYIGDEILSQGLTAAPHPGYVVRKEYLPPYEPNSASSAYIHRLGHVVDDGGKPRFMPFYAAGGFQGGTSKEFIKAMKVMKKNIDKDFLKNYTAIWNDESHWNKYLWDYKGHITYLDPSYIFPDSLIKEYYEPLWGRSYDPKIITLTKPFSLKVLTDEDRKRLGLPAAAPNGKLQCTQCGVILEQPGFTIEKVMTCNGASKPHEVQMKPV